MINRESWCFFLRRIERVACGEEFLRRLEYCLRAEGRPGVVAGERGLEFADDRLGSGFRDQVAFEFRAQCPSCQPMDCHDLDRSHRI